MLVASPLSSIWALASAKRDSSRSVGGRVKSPGRLAIRAITAASKGARRRVATLAVDRDLPEGTEEPRGPLRVEVLGLGQEGDPATDDQRDDERVTEGLVVGRDDGRAGGRHVFSPLDPHAEEQVEDGPHDGL